MCIRDRLIGTGAGAYGSIIGSHGVIYEDTDEFTARGFVPDCFRLPYDMLDNFASEKMCIRDSNVTVCMWMNLREAVS